MPPLNSAIRWLGSFPSVTRTCSASPSNSSLSSWTTLKKGSIYEITENNRAKLK